MTTALTRSLRRPGPLLAAVKAVVAGCQLAPCSAAIIGVRASDTLHIQRRGCPECAISFADPRPLGQGQGLAVDQARLSVAVTPDGRFVTTGIGAPGTVAVFGPDGRFQRVVGRIGAGPGEFLGPNRVVRGSAGQLIVVDPEQARLTVLTPALQYSHAMPIRRQVDRLVVDAAGLLVASTQPEPGLFRVPEQGEWRPFDRRPAARSPIREIAVSPSGELWTARADAYVLERWGPDGAVRQVVGRDVPWFPGPPTTVDLRRKPSPPALSGLMVDSGPALWVFVAETRLPFQPPVVTRPDGGQEVDLDLWLSRRDTRIEVLDPRRGTVVAATTHRGLLWPTGVFPWVYSVRDPLDDPVVVVHRVVTRTGRGADRPRR